MRKDVYPFTESFERAVVALAAENRRFYDEVGRELEVDALQAEIAQLIVRAVHAVAKDLGRGPGSSLVVLQRLRAWVHQGKVTHDELLDAEEYLSAPPASAEAVQAELLPVLRRRIHHAAVLAAHEQLAKQQGLEKAEALISKAKSLGARSVVTGVDIVAGGEAAIEEHLGLVRMPTGVYDLDGELGGGIPRGQLAVFVAESGGGKSMALSHVAAHTLVTSDKLCGYVTLELPPAYVIARVAANVTGIPIDGILAGAGQDKEAFAQMRERCSGRLLVGEFTPDATTVPELLEWVKATETQVGRKMDVLFVDYADKLLPPNLKKSKDGNSYVDMRHVYESLRVMANERDMWAFTASQSGGRANERKAKRVDMEHIADSMHKVRVADVVITLKHDSETQEMLFFVAKNRTGRSRFEVGPLPTDYACGAIAPVTRGGPGTPF